MITSEQLIERIHKTVAFHGRVSVLTAFPMAFSSEAPTQA